MNALSNEYRSRNSDSAIFYANEALRRAEGIAFTNGRGAALVNLGNVYRNLGQYPLALEHLQRALALGETAHLPPLVINALNGIGVVYIRQGSYDRALEALLYSLRLCEQTNDRRSKVVALDNIGIVYVRQSNYARALASLNHALALADSLGDKRQSSIALNDIAICYRAQQRYDEALSYYLRSLALKTELGDKQGSALTMNGIGIVYRAQGQYDRALEQFHHALQLQEELKFRPGIATLLSDIASTYFKQKRYTQSIEAAERCVAVAKEIGAKVELRNAYQTLADVYDALKQPSRSYEYFHLYVAMKDSLFNEETARKISDANARYENEVRDQRIRLLEREQQVQSLELQRKNFIVYGLLAIGALVLIVVGLLVYRIRERRRTVASLRAQNAEILRQQTLLEEQASRIQEANSLLQETNIALEASRDETERLLLNIIPASVAEQLKHGENLIAESFIRATVIFADIVGFTEFSSTLYPQELVQILSDVFMRFDAVIERTGAEKIKTMGDSYLIVCGVPDKTPRHAAMAAETALELMAAVERFNHDTGMHFALRIGMHCGPLVAGIIGKKKFAYDLWGDTVNIASRMESMGEAGKIHCSEALYRELHEELGATAEAAWQFEPRGAIEVKGKGTMQTWFLTGRQV